MLKIKSQLTCSHCARIFKDPILLPCNDSVCRQHLSEKDSAEKNNIKCNYCKQEFHANDNQFRSNNSLRKLVESFSYLTEEEKNLKQELEETLQKFFGFYAEIEQNKTQLESDVYEHFREIRFQIDEHRERIKARVDDIALAMIDATKKHEKMFMENLMENFYSSFDGIQSRETQLNQIEETFRDPNLLIQTIKDMQKKQVESLNDIQFKLKQMNQVKDDVKLTNGFKPNLSSINQKNTCLFGSINLSGYFSSMNLLKSQILKSEQQYSELLKLCEFCPTDKWSLLYRGTRDGFDLNAFHSKCDGHANTLTIFKAKQSTSIFGGFTAVEWDSTSHWKPDLNAFIFSLTNKDNDPIKIKIDPNRHRYAIYCDSEYGPCFGLDISIDNNADTTMHNFSDLGSTYKHPQYAFETDEAQTFLTGSYYFKLDEIEVYEKY
jgi:hypothetical protein